MKKLLLLLCTAALLTSCTENQRARAWGGNGRLELPGNTKLVNVTWKEADLWILTKPMTAKDTAETYHFVEESNWGVWEGSYTIVETKHELPKQDTLPVVGSTFK